MQPTSRRGEPLVSVVVPCYGGEAYLSAALESCAAQAYSNFEVIVVDDKSPDRCAEIALEMAAKDARFRVIAHDSNRGVSGAFNTGYAAAMGDYLTRLAQDDVWERDALARMVGVLEQEEGAGLTYGDYTVCDESGRALHVKRVPPPAHALRWGNHIGLAVLWRRSVWDRVGDFDSSVDTAEDYDYWLRASLVCTLARCEGPPLLRVRVHGDMGTVRQAARQGRATLAAVRRWRATMGWRKVLTAQQTLSKAHLSAALCYVDARQPGMSLREMIWSIACWPAPFGEGDPLPRNRWRLMVAQLRDLIVAGTPARS